MASVAARREGSCVGFTIAQKRSERASSRQELSTSVGPVTERKSLALLIRLTTLVGLTHVDVISLKRWQSEC
jgi:hypothetical protein